MQLKTIRHRVTNFKLFGIAQIRFVGDLRRKPVEVKALIDLDSIVVLNRLKPKLQPGSDSFQAGFGNLDSKIVCIVLPLVAQTEEV